MGAVSVASDTRSLIEGPHVHRNLSTPLLVETAIARGEASLASNGALVALTGARTGRSPRDKFIIEDDTTRDTIHWGKVNQPFPPEKFQAILDRVMRHMADVEAIHTYEGTETIQTLIVGRDITGVGAFT